MKLLFERSSEGRKQNILPPLTVDAYKFDDALVRKNAPKLPEISEVDLGRHYTELAGETHGVNDGFYPLGSCTMKYNPRVNEEMAGLLGFTGVHPLQSEAEVQGGMEVIWQTAEFLKEITGMDDFTMQPAAGAHGKGGYSEAQSLPHGPESPYLLSQLLH